MDLAHASSKHGEAIVSGEGVTNCSLLASLVHSHHLSNLTAGPSAQSVQSSHVYHLFENLHTLTSGLYFFDFLSFCSRYLELSKSGRLPHIGATMSRPTATPEHSPHHHPPSPPQLHHHQLSYAYLSLFADLLPSLPDGLSRTVLARLLVHPDP
jgi:hypothetical protein